MNPWCAGRIVEQRRQELEEAGAGRRRRVASGLRVDRLGQPAHGPGGAGQRVTVWCGYRMISMGSRLLRPALLAGAGA